MNYATLSRQIENMIRIGTVLEVNLSALRCRVKSGELETDWLHMPSQRAGSTRKWSPLTVGEQVIAISPSGVTEAGFVLPLGIFSDAITPPSNSADVELTEYPDGAIISYNHASHELSVTGIDKLTIVASGDINITNQGNTVVNTTGTADVTAGGKATVTADMIELNGGGAVKGCVQGDSVCAFTGLNHPHVSGTVKVSP